MSCFSLSLLLSLFLRIIPASFSRLKLRKKLSSEVSALKTELDLCRAEMETEHQTHQKEEKALHARVVEAEKQRDAVVEAMKNECNGIAGSFVSSCIQIFLSDDLFVVPGFSSSS